MKIFIILISILISSIKLVGQEIPQWNQGNIEQQNYFLEIPYTEVREKIIVEIEIANKLRKFIFDTGGGVSSLISEKLYREIQQVSIHQLDVFDAEGQSDSMKASLLPLLKINELSFTDVFSIVANNSSGFLLECLGVDGILGSGLFKHSIVQIDSRNKVMIITDDKNKLQLNSEFSNKMKLEPQSSCPVITALLIKEDQGATIELLFDTGDDSFFTIAENNYRFFIENNFNIFGKISESEGTFSFGVHGSSVKQYHYLLNLPGLAVNNGTVFRDLVIRTTHADNSRIGSQILKYGKTTLDYKDELFYFESYDNLSEINLTEKVWQIEPILEDNKFVVGIIWDKSLMNEVNVGDEILKFDDTDYQNKNLCEMMLTKKESEKQEVNVILKDIKTNDIKTVKIKRL